MVSWFSYLSLPWKHTEIQRSAPSALLNDLGSAGMAADPNVSYDHRTAVGEPVEDPNQVQYHQEPVGQTVTGHPSTVTGHPEPGVHQGVEEGTPIEVAHAHQQV